MWKGCMGEDENSLPPPPASRWGLTTTSLPASSPSYPTQLSAERRVALPGAGEDGEEEQQGDQGQQDGQHQHSSCQDSRQQAA